MAEPEGGVDIDWMAERDASPSQRALQIDRHPFTAAAASPTSSSSSAQMSSAGCGTHLARISHAAAAALLL